MERKIIFENGREFIGEAFGSNKDVVSEVIFDTGMVGYQEILSDPVYTDLSIVMTYPLIGNYGIIAEDFDSKHIGVKALITKEYNDKPSNFRYANTLAQTLEEYEVAGVTHVDTRAITKMLVKEGNMLACICSEKTTKEEAFQKIKEYKPCKNVISKVSCNKIWYSRCANPKYNIVTIDTGITAHNLLDFKNHKMNVTIVPYNTDYKKIMSLQPDGIFIPNGPGNPDDAIEIIETVKKLCGKVPIWGIGLGMNVLAIANGLKTQKMNVGHHGSNHSIRNVTNNKLIIVNQNHSYEVKNLKKDDINITHVNVLDGSIEGIDIPSKKAFGVQYYPNGVVNPQDSIELINKFCKYINE